MRFMCKKTSICVKISLIFYESLMLARIFARAVVFGEILRYMCVNKCATNYMYRENSREVHIVSGKPARCTYMGIYCSLNLNLNLKS